VKISKIWFTAFSLALVCSACSKKDSTPPPAAEVKPAQASVATSLEKSAAEVKQKVQETAAEVTQKATAEAVKAKAQAQELAAKAGEEVQKAKNQLVELQGKAAAEPTKLSAPVDATADAAKTGTTSATTNARSQAQNLIDQATKLVANTKYADAADKLKELGNFKLTPDQQKAVDNLGEQIQRGLATDAAKSVGNLFKPTK
jgi:hypothetical protein